jgi:hypothetical protein
MPDKARSGAPARGTTLSAIVRAPGLPAADALREDRAMRANVPLRDARPAVIVCPHCTRHLMEVKDVQ